MKLSIFGLEIVFRKHYPQDTPLEAQDSKWLGDELKTAARMVKKEISDTGKGTLFILLLWGVYILKSCNITRFKMPLYDVHCEDKTYGDWEVTFEKLPIVQKPTYNQAAHVIKKVFEWIQSDKCWIIDKDGNRLPDATINGDGLYAFIKAEYDNQKLPEESNEA